jgi:hypothetical protein
MKHEGPGSLAFVLCLWTILFRAPSIQAFNVGSEEAITIADLARTITAILNPALKIEVAKLPPPDLPFSTFPPPSTPSESEPSTARPTRRSCPQNRKLA